MDYQSRNRSDERQSSAKYPKLLHHSTTTMTAPPGMGSLFSMAQCQELELQALIYHYMVAEASVPLDLILSLKRSFISPSPRYFYHPHQPSILQTGYWGRCPVDLEPGRCRRTDGKKWRCSKEVVPGRKYCDHHVHRGRNRSRKHVEMPPITNGSKNCFKAATAALAPTKERNEAYFALSNPSPPLNIIPLNQRPSDGKTADGCPQGKGSNSRVMRFFEDWPKTEQESMSSNKDSTILSMSTPDNLPSNFSLKLSAGNGDWCGFENHGEASMGGPLAEALRSSVSTPSPTSVLQKLNGSLSSDTTCASA